jgi:hypothetical protein
VAGSAGRGVQHRAGHRSQGRAEALRPVGGQLGQDRLAAQGAEQEVGDHLGVEVGALRGDERTDVTVPELVDRVIVSVLRGTLLRRRLGGGRVGAGSPGKLAFLKELGADVAVDRTQPDWPDQVRLAAPGGLDVILEAVGGQTLHQSIGLLAPFGRVVVYGAAAGDLTSIPVTSLFPLKTVSGFSLLAWRAADPEQARADIAGLTGLLETGRLDIATTALPLAEAVQAHRLLEDRTVKGRLILLP